MSEHSSAKRTGSDGVTKKVPFDQMNMVDVLDLHLKLGIGVVWLLEVVSNW